MFEEKPVRDGENSAIHLAREKLEQIRARIERACECAGRDSKEITLIGASKTVSAETLEVFLRCGLEDCGENYVQEGIAKIGKVTRIGALPIQDTFFHFIGALQSNKAREAVQYFDFIHSVDRPSLIAALDKAAGAQNKIQSVLLQVNVGDEASKAGCSIQEARGLAVQIARCEHLKLCGLMCLPPYHENAELLRPYFQMLRKLRNEIISIENCQSATHLSMGMSNDFEIAIEEGTTMIRVGTALFGERDK